jgi:membrane-bound lytic murein transglycosylase A
LELVYVANEIEAFFIHIQGSARISLQESGVMRVGFAGKTGHPYTAIGKKLVEQNALPLEQAGMAGLKAWLYTHPERVGEILGLNQSYIFFEEIEVKPNEGPRGAANVPLTAGRSLAVDKSLIRFGTPIWLETDTPLPASKAPLQRLMIAQDTGSAIIGLARGDYFVGSGENAGRIAGETRLQTSFTLLIPK